MDLKCGFHFGVQEWKGYICVIHPASIKERRTRIKSICGQHQARKSDKDVEKIEFAGVIVEYLPRHLTRIFPNLTILQVYKCGLKEITRKDLMGFERLQSIWLQYNKLTTLPNDLFVHMRDLKVISMPNNQLESISSKLLEPLLENGLTLVDFRENKSIDSFYQASNKDSVRSVEKLMKIIDKKCSAPSDIERSTTKEFAEGFKDSFTKGFAELWISGRFSDFVIVVEKKEFRVHKNVLGIQSPVFAEIFEKDAEEARANSINIEGLSVEAVEQFLGYVYTGQVDDEADLIKLFTIAVKFNVPALKSICEENILDDLDESNALEVYNLGHLHLSDVLKQAAYNEIKNMFPDKTFPNEFLNQPQRLKDLVEMKRKTDLLFK